ncbi:MAG: sugar phosphate isomerase/epimerase [Clostridia bacterium]|nr:sugar phosphate isomerase/epimerase [Clostridia bacterium]
MPKLPLYCSTGAIIGRVNGYDYRHILRVMPPLCAGVPLDGLELMMLPAYLDKLPEMARDFAAAGLRFPIIHADKDVGTLLSTGAAQNDVALCQKAHNLWAQNCEMGQRIGARQIVLHLWGGLDSDAHLDGNLSHLDALRRSAAAYGLEVLIENVPCTTADPITNLTAIRAAFPDQRYVFDTRFASFHRQLDSLTATPWLIGDRLAHIHISDLRNGADRDFTRLRPILHPGEGSIDFPALLADLTARGYAGTVTLESPVMSEAGIDNAKLDASLRLLRSLLDRPITSR